MIFEVVSRSGRPSSSTKPIAYLTWDAWNDYSFYTLFGLSYIDDQSVTHHIGEVKIACFGQEKGASEKKLSIGDSFDNLDNSSFSLGQSDTYYTNLNKLGSDVRDSILIGLRDIARNSALFEKAVKEEVTKVSLFRDVSPTSVTGQYRRLARGGARLTDYNFKFVAPKIRQEPSSFDMTFNVKPESFPPTNIHVLIGRNGVGKTHLINNMIRALVDDSSSSEFGKFETETQEESAFFANLISVSFSAFDETEPKPEKKDKTEGIQYSYIGLKDQPDQDNVFSPKSAETLKATSLTVWTLVNEVQREQGGEM